MAYINPTVTKTFKILKNVMSSADGMRASEIARTSNMPKSTVHGIISALEELGVITKDPLTNKYLIGLSFFEFSSVTHPYAKLVENARPILQNMVERIQETVFLATRRGRYHIILHKAQPRAIFSLTVENGVQFPLLFGAAGKLFLASIKDAEAKAFLEKEDLARFSKNTITDPEKYLEEVSRVRREGYATDDEEYNEGVRAVACPINGARNLAPSIWVVGLKLTLNDKKMALVIREAMDAAHAISLQFKLSD